MKLNELKIGQTIIHAGGFKDVLVEPVRLTVTAPDVQGSIDIELSVYVNRNMDTLLRDPKVVNKIKQAIGSIVSRSNKKNIGILVERIFNNRQFNLVWLK